MNMVRSLALFCVLLLLGLMPACMDTSGEQTIPDDDDSAGDDDDSAGDDDDSAGDDDDSAGDDDDTSGPAGDQDGDGHNAKVDCNDGDPAVHPGADELCDGTDHNCDGDSVLGAIDAPTWYEDTDGDGYGTDSSTLESCFQPHGYSAHSGDCNDTDPSYHPGAAEADCTDPEDYNCDQSTGYADVDGDNEPACEDCNDNDININSAATEVCNAIDDDCDGAIDEAGATGESTWYLDADEDNYGRTSLTVLSCTQPPGYVTNSGDCNDLEPLAFPGATEVCDGIDNNCTDGIDEGTAAPPTWYLDADGDTFGNPLTHVTACLAPSGYVSDLTDCDDLDATSYPGATEICDGANNDCDSETDEGVTTTFFGDADGDGYGDISAPLAACFLPAGASVNGDDCDDGEPSAHPGGIELCDSLDNDCDGTSDENALDATTWYTDSDIDGYGNPLTGTVSCSPITGGVANGLDCDDGDGDNYPGNIESCDGSDENCNSLIDEGFDVDSDGVTICGADGILGNADDDCNDGDPNLFPGNHELCDALDQDCDQVADNGVDGDGDNITSCGPDGTLGNADDDCDDSDGANFPNNTEICDGQDNNCDTIVDEGFDADGDTYTTCGADGFIGSTDDDCDDDPATGFTTHPNAAEICDALDQDCDGAVDEGFDLDGDGFTTCGVDGIPGTSDDDCDDTTAGQGFNGSSPACPTISCKLLVDNFPSTASGPKWLDPESDGNPFQVYCDMDNHGGGWTLVLMTEDDDPGTFAYNSQYWDTTSLINETTTDPNTNENVKNEAYNSLSFVEIRLDMTTQGNSHILSTTHSSARALFTGGQLGVSYSRTDFLNWINVSNSNWNNQPHCNVKGFQISVDGGEAKCRYGITMNNENQCNSNDSALGFGCFTQFGGNSLRNISCGGFRWSADVRYNRRGWIYVR